MAEPDRTNADAERVSDIVAPAECKCDDPNCGFNHKPLTLHRAYENCLVRLRGSEDIIEAQSKALAEAREALLVADEHLTGIENYGGEPAVRARRGRAAINAALGCRS